MEASTQEPLQAAAVTLTSAGAAVCLYAPVYSEGIPIEIIGPQYAIYGGVIGAVAYSFFRLVNEIKGTPMFRFSIRELIFATVTVAIGCGWWVASAKSNQEQLKQYDQIKALQATVHSLESKLDKQVPGWRKSDFKRIEDYAPALQ